MRRAGWILMTVALVLGCVGCSGYAWDGPAATRTQLPDPAWQPVEEADQVAGATPSPLGKRGDLNAAVTARQGARNRVAGESFALQAAQVLTDIRHRVPGSQVLARIASDDLPDGVRRYLIDDVDVQQASGLQRHLDASSGVWIRSRLIGPESAPVRVEVEIAIVVVSEVWTYRKWYRTRYDVAWEDGRWSLVGFSDGSLGPTTTPLTPAERREFLPGPGWRFVPPA